VPNDGKPAASKLKPLPRRRGSQPLRRPKLRTPEPKEAIKGDPKTIRNALIIICLGALLSSIDATVTNIALNTLEHDLHTTVASVQWVMTAYLLTVAGVIPISGWASRRFGARQVYVTSLGLFGISSAMCALAGSLQVLVACRLLQGLAGGMLVPLGQLIAAEVAGSSQMGKMVSRIWSFSSIGAMVGPTVGGAILETMGWRWIFMVNVPISAMATIAAVYVLPRTPARPAGKLDVGGLLRLSIGVPAMVFALAQAEQTGSVFSPSAVIPMIMGVVLVLDFARHALRSAHPLLDVRLCARRTFRAGLISIFFFDIVWFGVLVLIPLCFQQLLHLSPLSAGMLMAPQGVGTATGMWFIGRVGNQSHARILGAIGTLMVAGTTMVIATFNGGMPFWIICITLLVAGFCAGISWIPATAASYAGLKGDEISHGSPLVAVVMRLGASFGTAIAAIMLQANVDSSPGHDLAPAFAASFHWEAALAVFAAVIYVWLCWVSGRAFKNAPADNSATTAEFAALASEGGTAVPPELAGEPAHDAADAAKPAPVPSGHNGRPRRTYVSRLGASAARRNAKVARDRLGRLLQRSE
jgi:EmrB/QacA subfamily drug resistance transporter